MKRVLERVQDPGDEGKRESEKDKRRRGPVGTMGQVGDAARQADGIEDDMGVIEIEMAQVNIEAGIAPFRQDIGKNLAGKGELEPDGVMAEPGENGINDALVNKIKNAEDYRDLAGS